MKKVLVVILLTVVAAMTLSVAIAFAEDKTTNVTFTPSSETFEWSVPTALSITAADTDATGDVAVTKLCALSGHALKVTVSSTNGWKMTKGTSEIAYKASLSADGTALANGDTVLTVNGAGVLSEQTGSSTLYARSTQAQINAATSSEQHTDTLTFSAAIS